MLTSERACGAGHVFAEFSQRPSASSCRPRTIHRAELKTHYTQVPSQLMTSTCAHGSGVVQLRGGGFLTRDMLDDALSQWSAADLPGEILVDVRDVLGYEAGCANRAEQFLHDAADSGVRKIAFVGSSTVLRTAMQLASENSRIDLRAFDHEPAARTWLGH